MSAFTFETSSARALATRPIAAVALRSVDTLLVAGGEASGLEALASTYTVEQACRDYVEDGEGNRARTARTMLTRASSAPSMGQILDGRLSQSFGWPT